MNTTANTTPETVAAAAKQAAPDDVVSPVAPTVTIDGIEYPYESVEKAQIAWLAAYAAYVNGLIPQVAHTVTETTTYLWWLLQESKAKQTWKFSLQENGKPFAGWKPFVIAKLGDELKLWAKPVRDQFIAMLFDDNFSTAVIGDMVGVSADTVERVLNGQQQGADTANGKAQAKSTATERFGKTVDGIVAKLHDQDRFANADLRNKLLVDETRLLMATLSEITRRGAKVPAQYAPLVATLAGMFPAEGDGSHLESGTEGQVGGTAHPAPGAERVQVAKPGANAASAANMAKGRAA